MPDPEKMRALEEAGFQVRKTCGLCVHWEAGSIDTAWGTCRAITYRHRKHTGGPRRASVPVGGWCPRFRMEFRRLPRLGAHQAYLEQDGGPE